MRVPTGRKVQQRAFNAGNRIAAAAAFTFAAKLDVEEAAAGTAALTTFFRIS